MIRLLTLLLALTLAGAADADTDVSWFAGEAEAVHALSDGGALNVFDCMQCDADDVRHAMTRTFIGHLLEEFSASGQPVTGAFLLRERARPRYAVSADDGLPRAVQVGAVPEERDCGSDERWTPSITRWEYDLGRQEALPVYTACVPALAPVSPMRMSCRGCDLDHPQLDAAIREQLEAAYWALLESQGPVSSGTIFFTDLVKGGFRRLDFRAYADRVYLGPADGQYYAVPVGDQAQGLAQTPP